MFRNGHFKPKQAVNIIFDDGGLGDNIARMTAIKYLKETFRFSEITLFVPDYFYELAINLVPKITVKKFSMGISEYNGKNPTRQTRNMHTTLRTHIVDHAFNVLCDKQMLNDDLKNYCKLRNLDQIDITAFNLPKDYVIITTGFTAPVREMLPEVVNALSNYVISKGFTPVFLGSKEAVTGIPETIIGQFKPEIDYSLGIDLINKTSLLQAGKIISQAKAIVGLDNGLLHLAGCTDIPIVGGYTTVEPILRLPYRNNILGWNCEVVVPETSLQCRFCQSNWDFIYNHNFKYCWYKDYKCVKALTADKYIEKLEKVLES